MPGRKADFNLGAIAAACSIAWIMFRHPDRDWLGPRPTLAAWLDSVVARPSMQETEPRS